ncbi:MAG: UDP-N-acetylglucosamine 2-epimerase (non-hydrolyzing) [Candidatus Omnitrophica bacterium]|nr:UDP-N-acetylglucosamine 2-epimerase (non-hydrolyzing) [Candidatus Omnitrophota bacterium]
MKIMHVVGARPNFMKVDPVMRAITCHKRVRQLLVHTGQHYDIKMSAAFFRDLDIPIPDVNLGVGSGSHAWQTAEIMRRLEPVLLKQAPDLLLVYGDVNSTVAAAMAAAKICIPCGHVEAGLRSFDKTMPEEINRVITDSIADILFTPSEDADKNLLREGVSPRNIHMVGNVMIDTLVRMLPRAKDRFKEIREKQEFSKNLLYGGFGLVTIHRPENVDDASSLKAIMNGLAVISRKLPLIFPVHPRTRKQLKNMKNAVNGSGLYMIDPLSYLDFLALQCNAMAVITDSGGIQEETTYLGVPCLTIRNNTERPVTVTVGTNTIIGHNIDKLKKEVKKIIDGHGKKGAIPPKWDGHAADRIAKIIMRVRVK